MGWLPRSNSVEWTPSRSRRAEKHDVVWRNHVTGEVFIWTAFRMNDGGVLTTYTWTALPTIADLNWKIVGP